jgi:succinate-acetate transporter protein
LQLPTAYCLPCSGSSVVFYFLVIFFKWAILQPFSKSEQPAQAALVSLKKWIVFTMVMITVASKIMYVIISCIITD